MHRSSRACATPTRFARSTGTSVNRHCGDFVEAIVVNRFATEHNNDRSAACARASPARCKGSTVCRGGIAQADIVVGRYRAWDEDPRKQSFNAGAGRHPLGKRARKLDEGVLTVRCKRIMRCDAHA